MDKYSGDFCLSRWVGDVELEEIELGIKGGAFMVNKWRIILFFFLGSSTYYGGVERLEVATFLGLLLLLILPMLLGWGTCKIYSFLERKIDPQKYISIVMSVFVVPATFGLYIVYYMVHDKSWIILFNILLGLGLCINAVFSMFFDKQGQTNPS